MTARLASSVLVTFLLRRAEAEGGFGAVLAKGDAGAGSILVILLERGAAARLLERVLQPDGAYRWDFAGGPDSAEALREAIERRRRFDPDLWVIELDVPSSEGFATGMNALD